MDHVDKKKKDDWLRKRMDKQDKKIDDMEGSIKEILQMLKNAKLEPKAEQVNHILQRDKIISSPEEGKITE